MKRTLCVAVLVVGFLMAAMPVSAGVFVFEPDPADLGDLRHDNAWTWGLEFADPGWYFEEVVLTFKNIQNTAPLSSNILFIRLLDDVTLGTTKYWDDPNVEEDYFECYGGVLIEAWEDDVFTGVDLTYTFSSLGFLDDWSDYVANDGMVGFGFDPDCHFENDGIELTVTGAVPEPGTMMLFALGMVSGVAAYRKKRK